VTRPEPGLLSLDIPVRVGVRDLRLERLAGTADKPIVRLSGVDSRDAVEALRGEPLWVSREYAPPLEQDEFWADDLRGLAVVDGDRPVGVVERVMSLPSCEVLVVGELLIPLIGDAVRSVDIEAGRVDVDLGFLGEG
jgi:16S rRNA processing protein RimM